MAPTKATPCRFFAQGLCRNGDSCYFIHEPNVSPQSHFEHAVSAFPAVERPYINLAVANHLNGRAKSNTICRFFMQGSCNKSDKCLFIHPSAILPPQQALPDAISPGPRLGQLSENSPEAPSDSRARVPCKFLSRPSGCQNSSCPYLHAIDGHEVEESNSQDLETHEDEVSS